MKKILKGKLLYYLVPRPYYRLSPYGFQVGRTKITLFVISFQDGMKEFLVQIVIQDKGISKVFYLGKLLLDPIT